MTNREVFSFVSNGNRMEIKLSQNPLRPFSDMLYDLMLKCWKTKSDIRPTFEFIKKYLKDLKSTIAHNIDDPTFYGKKNLVDFENCSNHLLFEEKLSIQSQRKQYFYYLDLLCFR
ncbi:uncharacterized protein LOC144743303 [Ciona intestinalis]